MENEIDINLSVLLRTILKEYGQIRLTMSGLANEAVSDDEYKVVINLVDDEFLEISLEPK